MAAVKAPEAVSHQRPVDTTSCLFAVAVVIALKYPLARLGICIYVWPFIWGPILFAPGSRNENRTIE